MQEIRSAPTMANSDANGGLNKCASTINQEEAVSRCDTAGNVKECTSYVTNSNGGTSIKKGHEYEVFKSYGIRHCNHMRSSAKQRVIKLNFELDHTIHKLAAYETEEARAHRQRVLHKLDSLVSRWLNSTWKRKKNYADTAEVTVEKRLLTFGSCGMGVQCQGTDVDLLVVAPQCIPREEFFTSFVSTLQHEPGIRCLRAIQESYVPVIKVEYDGVQLDVLFANVKAATGFPSDQELLEDIDIVPYDDIKSLRSLNGYRISEEIISQVPNVDAFRLALRAVKLWAKAKGIYSNILGFLGGVSYSILVARTCQLYPDDSGAALVYKFFCLFANWEWSEPVMLCDVDCTDRIARGDISYWNPRGNERDRCQLMPIITPCLPPINSAYNVTKSSFIIMLDEIKDAAMLTNEIISRNKPWDKLFEAENFYRKYNYFAIVTAKSHYDVDLHAEWTGLVESKLRLLVCMLEECREISIAHINPTSYPSHTATVPASTPQMAAPSPLQQATLHMTRWSIGLSITVSSTNIDLMTVANQFKSIVLGHSHRFSIHAGWTGYCELDVSFCDGFALQNFLPPKVIFNVPDQKTLNPNSNTCINGRRHSLALGNGLETESYGDIVTGRNGCRGYYQSSVDLLACGRDDHASNLSMTPSLHSVKSWPDIASALSHRMYMPPSNYPPPTTTYHQHLPYLTGPIITNGYNTSHQNATVSPLVDTLNLINHTSAGPLVSTSTLAVTTNHITSRLNSLCLATLEPAVQASPPQTAGLIPSRRLPGFVGKSQHQQKHGVAMSGGGRRRRHATTMAAANTADTSASHIHRQELAPAMVGASYSSRSVPELRSPPLENVRDVALPLGAVGGVKRSDIRINLKGTQQGRQSYPAPTD